MKFQVEIVYITLEIFFFYYSFTFFLFSASSFLIIYKDNYEKN